MRLYLVFNFLIISLYSFGQTDNQIEVAARHEFFEGDLTDRSFFYVHYGRKINKHDLFIRVNSLHRGGSTGFLYEVDFYPKFSEKSYGYFNIGYSGFELYPQLRTAAEYYQGFGGRWEASLGFRTIHPNEDYTIYAPTGTLGVYYGNWYTYIRPTLNILEDGVSSSIQFVTRRYSGDGKDYLEFLFLNGEDRGAQRQFNAIENTFGLKTYVFRLRGVKQLNDKYMLSLGTDFSGLFIPERDRYIKIYSIDTTIRRYF